MAAAEAEAELTSVMNKLCKSRVVSFENEKVILNHQIMSALVSRLGQRIANSNETPELPYPFCLTVLYTTQIQGLIQTTQDVILFCTVDPSFAILRWMISAPSSLKVGLYRNHT